ncbi:MAG: MFS transporter [Proteobacteria bacterium]|nr:MFS transporter [Pseudomonadota bacterium]
MTEAAQPAPKQPARPKGMALFRAALANRKAACMLGFGFVSGLPFALLIGTINAWLGEVGIKLATIGVLSWIGLAYSFKFLWSPLVDRWRLPGLDRLGRRKSWIALCQVVLLGGIIGLALTDPKAATGQFAMIAFIAALASATQDVAIDAWRIEAADAASPIETLSAIYQFGYRVASIFGGAFALMLAARMSWHSVFLLMAGVFAVAALLTTRAEDQPRGDTSRLHSELGQPGELAPATRAGLLFVVLASWTWAVISVVSFMTLVLAPVAPGGKPPSVADFTRTQGPWIIFATVVVPLIVAALANMLRHRAIGVQAVAEPAPTGLRPAANHLYSALVAPLAELSQRLGWGVLSLLGVILTYAVAYNIWASFAFPFYLDYLHYTKDQVAFASKIFGIVMTMIGISLCGYLFVRIGRFPTVLLGAVLPPAGNLVYADLAEGGHGIDAVAHLLRLDVLAQWFGSDERMVRLLLAISFENISVGIALTALVAYISGMVNKRYSAIQFALLSSLVSLVGTLGRGVAGEAFGRLGYAPVFRWTALTGVVAVVFVGIEWARSARAEAAAKAD